MSSPYESAFHARFRDGGGGLNKPGQGVKNAPLVVSALTDLQGDVSPPSGGPGVSSDGGDHSAVIGTVAVLVLAAAVLTIGIYLKRARGLHLLKSSS